MNTWLSSNGLSPPAVPEHLVPRLDRLAPHTWATRSVDPVALYQFRWSREDVVALGDDTFVLSYHGHGVNSYALTVVIVVPGLTVITQQAWGGVYTDAQQTTRLVTEMFDALDELLRLNQTRSRPEQLCVIASPFRDLLFIGSCDEYDGTPHGDEWSWKSLPQRLSGLI